MFFTEGKITIRTSQNFKSIRITVGEWFRILINILENRKHLYFKKVYLTNLIISGCTIDLQR